MEPKPTNRRIALYVLMKDRTEPTHGVIDVFAVPELRDPFAPYNFGEWAGERLPDGYEVVGALAELDAEPATMTAAELDAHGPIYGFLPSHCRNGRDMAATILAAARKGKPLLPVASIYDDLGCTMPTPAEAIFEVVHRHFVTDHDEWTTSIVAATTAEEALAKYNALAAKRGLSVQLESGAPERRPAGRDHPVGAPHARRDGIMPNTVLLLVWGRMMEGLDKHGRLLAAGARKIGTGRASGFWMIHVSDPDGPIPRAPVVLPYSSTSANDTPARGCTLSIVGEVYEVDAERIAETDARFWSRVPCRLDDGREAQTHVVRAARRQIPFHPEDVTVLDGDWRSWMALAPFLSERDVQRRRKEILAGPPEECEAALVALRNAALRSIAYGRAANDQYVARAALGICP